MGNVQDEVENANKEFRNRLERILREAMEYMRKPVTPLKQQLMSALLDQLKTDGDHVKALAVPDEGIEAMEQWFEQNKMPFFTLPARGRENVILLSDENYEKAFDYYHQIEMLDPVYTAWSDMKDFTQNVKDTGERSVAVLDFGSFTEENGIMIDEIKDEIIDKMHDYGHGHTVGFSDLPSKTGEGGEALFHKQLAVQLDSVVDADRNTPDLVTVLSEVAVDSVNSMKAMTKIVAHKVDEKNMDMFLDNINMHSSSFLTDALSSSSQGSLRYDGKQDRLLYKQPGTNYERVIMDTKALTEFRKNPAWQKHIKSQLSHYTRSINNMVCLDPAAKDELDRTSADILREKAKSSASLLYDTLADLEHRDSLGEAISIDDIDPSMFAFRPSFGSKEFKDIVNEKTAEEGGDWSAINYAVFLDEEKDKIADKIAEYVEGQRQVLSGYSTEGKITRLISDINRDFACEGGIFDEVFKDLHDKHMDEDGINYLKDSFKNLMDDIKVRPVDIVIEETRQEEEAVKDFDIDITNEKQDIDRGEEE